MPLSGAYFYPGLNNGFNYFPINPPLSLTTSSIFVGDAYSVVLGPIDVSDWSNYKVFIVNNSVNNLKSGSVEVSPNNSNWEVLNTASFLALTSSGMASFQVSNVSNQYLRVRAWPSGSGGAVSGSVSVILNANI